MKHSTHKKIDLTEKYKIPVPSTTVPSPFPHKQLADFVYVLRRKTKPRQGSPYPNFTEGADVPPRFTLLQQDFVDRNVQSTKLVQGEQGVF